MVWYSHLLKKFPQFVVIHTVKGFNVVNEAEIDVFLELSCFFDDPTDVGNLISGSSAFSKTSLNIWKFTIHVLLNPGLENFEHYFTSVGKYHSIKEVATSVQLTLNSRREYLHGDNSDIIPTDTIKNTVHVLAKFKGVCVILLLRCYLSGWRIHCTILSTGNPSPPLALLVLPKAHLTSYSRMSGSR